MSVEKKIDELPSRSDDCTPILTNRQPESRREILLQSKDFSSHVRGDAHECDTKEKETFVNAVFNGRSLTPRSARPFMPSYEEKQAAKNTRRLPEASHGFFFRPLPSRRRSSVGAPGLCEKETSRSNFFTALICRKPFLFKGDLSL